MNALLMKRQNKCNNGELLVLSQVALLLTDTVWMYTWKIGIDTYVEKADI